MLLYSLFLALVTNRILLKYREAALTIFFVSPSFKLAPLPYSGTAGTGPSTGRSYLFSVSGLLRLRDALRFHLAVLHPVLVGLPLSSC